MKGKKKRYIILLLGLIMVFINLRISPVWAKDVVIDEETFPDPVFRQYVMDNFDKNGNGILGKKEIEAVYRINVENKGINSLQGVGEFVNLRLLSCSWNNLTELPITFNHRLETLYCDGNKLQYLNLLDKPRLKTVWCYDNELDSLTVEYSPNIEVINCKNNKLKNLDLSNLAYLKRLVCSDNQIENLNISGDTALEYLNCDNNKIGNLDLSTNTALKDVYCDDNNLYSLDVRHLSDLEFFTSQSNHLTSIDLSYNHSLKNISPGPQTYKIQVDKNALKFDLSKLPAGFDVSKAYDWRGGSLSGNILTLDYYGVSNVTYSYDDGAPDGKGRDMFVFLKVEFTGKKRSAVTVEADENGSASAKLGDTTIGYADEEDTVKLVASPKHGYKFKEWEVIKPKNLQITNDQFVMPDREVQVKAIFKKDFRTYSFDANGGTGKMDPINVYGDDIFTVPLCTFTPPEGKVFEKWVRADDESISLYHGNRIASGGDLTFKAIWKDKEPDPEPGENLISQINIKTNIKDILKVGSPVQAPTISLLDSDLEGKVSVTFSDWLAFNGGREKNETGPTFNASDTYVCYIKVTLDDPTYDFGYPLEIKGDGLNWTVYPRLEDENYLYVSSEPITLNSEGPTPDVAHNVNIQHSENGTVTADKTKAKKGETVTLTITPDSGYEVDKVVAMGIDASMVPVAGNQFTMPDKSVYVRATFKPAVTPIPDQAHDVIVYPAENGTVTADKTKAKKGETVTLTITPDEGYEVNEIVVKDDGASTVLVTDNKFTMPDMLVNVRVTFKKTEVTPSEPVEPVEPSEPVEPPTPSEPADPSEPPRPYRPYPWTGFPGYWYYEVERPKPIEEKKINSVEIDWKIQLTIGKDLLHKEINGVESNIKMDIAPYIKDGRSMLPARFVAEALGFEVEWIDSTRTVVLKQADTRIEIPVDTNKIIVNGKVYTSDVLPEIKNGRTMLSIANIARALGLQDGKGINWDENTRTVTITRSIILK